jgi:hypothetical protein
MEYNETNLKGEFMTVALKLALQTLMWFVALIIANNLLEKLWSKLKVIKPWKLKKA